MSSVVSNVGLRFGRSPDTYKYSLLTPATCLQPYSLPKAQQPQNRIITLAFHRCNNACIAFPPPPAPSPGTVPPHTCAEGRR